MKKTISIFVAAMLLFACSEKKSQQTEPPSAPKETISKPKMPDSIRNKIIHGIHPEAHQDEIWIADISMLEPTDQNGDDIAGDFDGEKGFQYSLKEFLKKENLQRNQVRVGTYSYSRTDADTFHNARPIFLYNPGREIK